MDCYNSIRPILKQQKVNEKMAGSNMWLHWCPVGCGKCVIVHIKKPRGSKQQSTYKCNRCNKTFIKEELL